MARFAAQARFKLALRTAQISAHVQNRGMVWDMCSKHCDGFSVKFFEGQPKGLGVLARLSSHLNSQVLLKRLKETQTTPRPCWHEDESATKRAVALYLSSSLLPLLNSAISMRTQSRPFDPRSHQCTSAFAAKCHCQSHLFLLLRRHATSASCPCQNIVWSGL